MCLDCRPKFKPRVARSPSFFLCLTCLSRWLASNQRAALVLAFVFCWAFASARRADAGFAVGASVTTGEAYDDNIRFEHPRQSDFITYVVPTFTFLYAPPLQTTPTFISRLSATGQIFAQHSERNNFGDNISFDASYIYRYSPKLTFFVADTARRGGDTHTPGMDDAYPSALPSTPTMFPAGGTYEPVSVLADVGPLLTKGRTLSNTLSIRGAWLATSNLSISGGYENSYSNTSDGNELSNSFGFRGVYQWRLNHNIHAGYRITFLNSSRGGSDVLHSFDFGDDFFTAYRRLNLQLTPTLTLSGGGGVALNTSDHGPGLGGNANLTLIKLWPTATFSIAARRELSNSFGISRGPAQVTSFPTAFVIRLTERLRAGAGAEFTLFDSEDAKSKIFRVGAGAEYWFMSWLSSKLIYGYRGTDTHDVSRHASKDVTQGKMQGGQVSLSLSMHFDVYPRSGFSRAPIDPFMTPTMGSPAFPAPLPESDSPQSSTPLQQ